MTELTEHLATLTSAVVLGATLGVALRRFATEWWNKVIWSVVDLIWVLCLVFTVTDKVVTLDQTAEHADRAAQGHALALSQQAIRLGAYLAHRKACPTIGTASAPLQNPPLCKALDEVVFDSTSRTLSVIDARRLERQITAADSSDATRMLRLNLADYAARSASMPQATETGLFDGEIEQRHRLHAYLWLLIVPFGLRVGRSAADLDRALKAPKDAA